MAVVTATVSLRETPEETYARNKPSAECVWIIFGGLAVAWLIAAPIMVITIIDIP